MTSSIVVSCPDHSPRGGVVWARNCMTQVGSIPSLSDLPAGDDKSTELVYLVRFGDQAQGACVDGLPQAGWERAM